MSDMLSAADRARLQRAHGLHAIIASALRAAGLAALLLAFALHNHYLLGALDMGQFTRLCIGAAAYTLITFVILHLAYSRWRPRRSFDFRNFFQFTDALGCVVLVYLSGGEKSWMFVFIAMAVMNQTHASAVRATVTGHVTVLAYAAAILVSGVANPAAAWTKVILLYIAVGLCTFTAIIAQRYRREFSLQLQKAKSIAERLQVAGRATSESLELDEVLARVLDQLRQVIDYNGASIQLLEGDTMRVIAARGLPDEEIGRVRPLNDYPYNRRLATSREPVILDLPAPEVWFPVPGREELRSVMGVPLIVRDKHIGAMSIDSFEPRAFGRQETEIAKGFAAHVAIAIDNARLYEAVRQQSWRDGLTGIANRRRFDEIHDLERRRAVRSSAPLSVLMIDIDHFKLYNDHYGHAAGDEVLRTVATELQKSFVRAGDFFARYGGEEFVALMPSTPASSALAHAKKLCERIAALAIPHERSPYGVVTLSLGVGTSVEEADRALYEAKRAGRNRAAGASQLKVG